MTFKTDNPVAVVGLHCSLEYPQLSALACRPDV